MRDVINYHFEELPLWVDGEWSAGTIDGHAEIEFTSPLDFTVTDVAITADNGKVGDEAQSRRVWVGASNPLLPILIRSLILTRRSQIEDDIAARIADCDPGAERADLRHSEHHGTFVLSNKHT